MIPPRKRAPRRAIVALPENNRRSLPTDRVTVLETANGIDLTALLRAGMDSGSVAGPWYGELPRYVWSRAGDNVREFQLVDVEQGGYSSYELHPSEWPEGLA